MHVIGRNFHTLIFIKKCFVLLNQCGISQESCTKTNLCTGRCFFRECGWRSCDSLLASQDPCVVCLERECTVAAQGNLVMIIILIYMTYG